MRIAIMLLMLFWTAAILMFWLWVNSGKGREDSFLMNLQILEVPITLKKIAEEETVSPLLLFFITEIAATVQDFIDQTISRGQQEEYWKKKRKEN